jgi:iron complex transport system substrate-binding protein
VRTGALLLLVAACGAPPPPGAEAGRIVSLLPSYTEILVELDAGDRIVACTAHCRPGREGVKRVPWQDTGGLEAILRVRPDLVLKQKPRREQDPLGEALERSGIAVLALPSETIGHVRSAIVAIGGAIGLGGKAKNYLARFDDEMERARDGARGRPSRSVLFVFGRDPGRAANITAAGPGSFLDELIRYAGGSNVLADFGAPYPVVRLETVLRRKPEVIIDNQTGETDWVDVWSEFDWMPAVREKRVFRVEDPQLLIPGPHLPRAVRRLVEMIHGGA